ncbi:MAG: aspartate ammonia-lyase, partial [Candidatus Eisenbacteria bacterium]|nr:aspartate ammonia-lyase [Candidatus Eisenbacteria bacterium]
ATQIRRAVERLDAAAPDVEELALGGTAVGTGLNTPAEFGPRVIRKIAEETGIPFRPAGNRFEALAARDALIQLMGTLNTLAVALMKIGTDLRILSSGPRAGLGEIRLPALQPGSSIMPGKVNPVIPEVVIQVAAQTMGLYTAVSTGGQHGPLELNMMMPLIGYDTHQALQLLTGAVTLLNERCIAGLVADRERCAGYVEWSSAMVTPLALKLGYEEAARIAKAAFQAGRTIREYALSEKILPEKEIEALLDPGRMASGEPPEAD